MKLSIVLALLSWAVGSRHFKFVRPTQQGTPDDSNKLFTQTLRRLKTEGRSATAGTNSTLYRAESTQSNSKAHLCRSARTC
jgi:hypothetical protein